LRPSFFNGRLEIIPMTGTEATYDYDGTDQEYRMITRMLQTNEGRKSVEPDL